MTKEGCNAFEQIAAAGIQENPIGENWRFLNHNKKWWLLPVLIVPLILGGLLLLSASAAAPLIYTRF